MDLNNDTALIIDIPDALCERDKVKFTVHTKVKLCPKQTPFLHVFIFTLCARDVIERKATLSSQTTLSSFQKPDFSVPRQHEDFIWLHDTLVETEEYAGLIVSLIKPT